MDTASLTRFIVLIVGLLNMALTARGYQVISDDFVNDVVLVITGAYALYAAWKNNYLTKKGQAQKELLKENNLH